MMVDGEYKDKKNLSGQAYIDYCKNQAAPCKRRTTIEPNAQFVREAGGVAYAQRDDAFIELHTLLNPPPAEPRRHQERAGIAPSIPVRAWIAYLPSRVRRRVAAW